MRSTAIIGVVLVLLSGCGGKGGSSGPELKVVSVLPANGASGVEATAAIKATFDAAPDTSALSAAFTVSDVSGSVSFDAASLTATFTPSSPLPPNHTFTATIHAGLATSSGATVAKDVTWSFDTNDATPPSVLSVKPAEGSEGQPRTALVQVTFSEPVAPSTVSAATFLVESDAGKATGTIAYDASSHTATFVPSEPYFAGITYRVHLTSGITDVAGNALSPEFTSSFRTVTDMDPPHVLSVTPPNGAAGVDPMSKVVVQFDEAMDATSITAASVHLTPDAGGTVAYVPSTKQAVITPDALLSGQTYTATVSGVKDAAGNPLAADYVWSFTILRDTTPPTVVSTVPANNATGVLETARTVTIVFSEPVKNFSSVYASRGASSVSFPTTYDAPTRTLTGTLGDNPLVPGASYSVTVYGVQDLANNALSTYVLRFTVSADSVPPTVVSTTPTDSAVDVPGANRTVSIVFSEPVTNFGGVTASRGGTNVSFPTTYSAATKTLTGTIGDNPLASSATYTITVAGVKDLYGNSIASPYVFTFKAEADRTPPTVALKPGDGAHLVPVNTKLTAVFSEDLDPSTINASSLGITGVTGTFSYAAMTRTATFTPSAPLALGTQYTVTVAGTIKDLAGNALVPVTATFRTPPVPVAISGDTKAAHDYPKIAFNAAGDGIAAWVVRPGYDQYDRPLAYSLYTAATGAWSAPAYIQHVMDLNGVAAATGRFAIGYTPGNTAPTKTNVAILENGNLTTALILQGYAVSVAATGGQIVAWTSNTASVYSGGVWGNTFTMPGPIRTALGSAAGVAFATVNYTSNGFGGAIQPTANVVWNGSTWSSSGVLFNAQQASQVSANIASNGTGFAFSWVWDSTGGSSYGNRYPSVLTWSGGTFSAQTSWSIQYGGGQVFLASDGAGYMAAWFECPNVPNCTPQVRWRRYTAGAWTMPAIAADTKNGTSYSVDAVALTGTPSGYVLAIDRAATSTSSALVSSTFSSASGTWGAEQPLGVSSASDFKLLANGANVFATWDVPDTVNYGGILEADVAALGSTGWSTPSKFYTPPQRLSGWMAASNGSGGLTFALGLDGAVVTRTFATTLSAEASLSSSSTIGGDAYGAHLVVLDDGTAFAAWLQYDKGLVGAWGARWANKTWGTPVQLATDATIVDLATDGTTVLAVMGGTNGVTARTLKNGTVSAAATLDSGGMQVEYLRAAAGGGFAAVWFKRSAPNFSTYALDAAASADGATWTTPEKLSSASSSPSIDVGAAAGQYAVVWSQNGTTNATVYSGGSWSTPSALATTGLRYANFVSDGSTLQLLTVPSNGSPAAWTVQNNAWTSSPLPVSGNGGDLHAARNGKKIVAYYVWQGGTQRVNLVWDGTTWKDLPAAYVDSAFGVACDGKSCLAFRSSFGVEAGSILDDATPTTSLGIPYSSSYPAIAGGGGTMGAAYELTGTSGPIKIWAISDL